MTRAPVNKIIPFSFVDGKGNRTAVFLQGCNQSCLYCHNPETIRMCSACGICVEVCPGKALSLSDGEVRFAAERCLSCDSCIRICPNLSSPRIQELTAAEVFDRIKQYLPFIDGVTVSGGECTLRLAFLRELFTLVHEAGRTTYIDTNGQMPLWSEEPLLAVTDKAMVDLKAGEEQEHRMLTGLGMETVLRNITELARRDKLYEIRTVVVPGVLDNARTVRLGASLIAPFPQVRYKLIKYRPYGVRPGVLEGVREPDDAYMEPLRDAALAAGVADVVIS